MLLFFIMQTVCSAQYAITGSNAAANAVIAAIFLFYGSYDIAYTPLIVSYTVEILPYQLRAKGFTVFNFAISLSLIFNQYANPIALDKLGWKYYVSRLLRAARRHGLMVLFSQIVYCVVLAFELVFVYFFLVETKNVSTNRSALSC